LVFNISQINGLSPPIKRHKLTDWIHKQEPEFCCIQETYLSGKHRYYLRIKGWKKFPSKWSKETSWSNLSNIKKKKKKKKDFQSRVIKKDGEGHFIFIKGKLHQEKVSTLNIYVPTLRASSFVKETLLELKAQN
jgi:exonuclease III